RGLRLPRTPLPEPAPKASPPAMRPVELWDLVSAFGRLMRETLAHQPQTITLDHTPLHVHMDALLARLAEQPRLAFSALFVPPHTRARLVGPFLAILELAKGQRIQAEQAGPFDEIWLSLAPSATE